MSGLPGLLLFLGTALAPFALLRRRRRRPLVYAFAVSYATMLIGMSGLSVPGWKTFWAMFALGIVGLGSSKEAGHS
jgi:cyanate permease